MKKIIGFTVIGLILVLALAACGGETSSASATQSGGVSATAATETTAGNDAELSNDYRDALPLETQLALGTMQLENTNLAITAEQAEALLPYWRVMQSLTETGNAAEAEINAVIKEIQNGMSGEQIASIAAMELTEDKVQTMLEEGTLNFGFGRGFGRDGQDDGSGGGFPGGGFPGGGPGGGFPGGGPGGGPGGLGGDPGAFATRQAEFEASGENSMSLAMDRLSSNMVIRLLETKTGEAPEGGFGGFGAAFDVVRELSSLSEEELNAAMAEGQTLGEILEANGVSMDETREAIKAAMADVQLPPEQDLDSWIDELLAGSFGGGPRPGTGAGHQPQPGLPDGFSD
jgi:hypothetical protein